MMLCADHIDSTSRQFGMCNSANVVQPDLAPTPSSIDEVDASIQKFKRDFYSRMMASIISETCSTSTLGAVPSTSFLRIVNRTALVIGWTGQITNIRFRADMLKRAVA